MSNEDYDPEKSRREFDDKMKDFVEKYSAKLDETAKFVNWVKFIVNMEKDMKESLDTGNQVAAFKLLGSGARHLPTKELLEEFKENNINA